MGLPCNYPKSAQLQQRSWVMVEATVELKSHALFRGQGPVLTAVSVTAAEPATRDVATF